MLHFGRKRPYEAIVTNTLDSIQSPYKYSVEYWMRIVLCKITLISKPLNPTMDSTVHQPRDLGKNSLSKARSAGFSLLELLVVISIMVSLTGLTLVSIGGVRNSFECKHAVNLIMETVENARLTALQNGSNVYVVLAIGQDAINPSDAITVVGDPPISSETTKKIWYTRWSNLPKNVRFLNSEGTLTGNQLPDTLSTTDLPPLATGHYVYTAFAFNSTGQVIYPAGSNLVLALQPSGKSMEATNQLYDIILLSRFTGKVRTEVSNLANLGIQ